MQNDSIDNIRLDINKKSERAAIYLRIGDTVSRTVHCTLARAGKVVSLQNAVVASILIKKPNGYESDNSVVIVGDELQYTWRTSDVSTEGENICQFVVAFEDGATLATPEFSMYAYKKIVDQKTEKSFNEYTTIQQQVAMTKQFVDSAEKDAESAKEAAQSAQETKTAIEETAEQIDLTAAAVEENAKTSAEASNKAEAAARSTAEIGERVKEHAILAEESAEQAETAKESATGSASEAANAAETAEVAKRKAEEAEAGAVKAKESISEAAYIASEKAADAEKSVSEAQRILQQLIMTAVCNITMNGETLQKDQEGSVNLGNVLTGGEQTITSSEDGAINVYTFSDGSTITIKNGDTGAAGPAGKDGTSAGFGEATASVDANTGTPSVTVTESGPDTAKVFNFAFKNLKGAKGDTGAAGPAGKDGTSAEVATATSDGLMSAEDKKRLDEIWQAIQKLGYPIG